MKLRNKKTGEIGELPDGFFCGDNLKKICEEWEDAPEEPKEYWYVSCDGRALKATTDEDDYNEKHNTGHKQIGNYFETEQEAEKAVEKLKAWKRLKDKGISFEVKVLDRKWYLEPKAEPQQRTFDEAHDLYKDIIFIFGGEE